MSLLRRNRPQGSGSSGNPQFKQFVLPVKKSLPSRIGNSSDDDDDRIRSARRNRQALQSGASLALKRLPFMSFLSAPPEVTTQRLLQQFKSPGATRTSESDRLLHVKTLGMRRRWGAFVTKDPVRHDLPPLIVEDDYDDDSAAVAASIEPEPTATEPPAVDAPPPLVLWQSESDPSLRVVVPDIVGKFLRPHQREGVQFMFDCVAQIRGFDGMGCILADDMGLGKTLQSITLMYTLFMTSMTADKQPSVKRAIVVCPTSLVKNWDDEIIKWLHGRVKTIALFEANRDAVIKGIVSFIDGAKRPRHNAAQVLVISYETFRMHAQRFIDAPVACDLLICDEAHRLKNAQSQINKALSALQCRRRVLLSGTPMQNDLEEFFAMVDFTNPGILGSASAFRKTYLTPVLVGREPDATDNERDAAANCSAQLCEIVNQFILRRGNILNAKHLPPKLMQVVCCPLSPLQETLYAHFLGSSAFRAMMNKQNANVLSSITALKKLCNHPLLIFDEFGKSNTKLPGFDNCAPFFADARRASSGNSSATDTLNRRGGSTQRTCHPEWSGKMLLLDRLMMSMKQSTSDRIVVVSNYTQTLDVVSDLCRERHLPFVRLDGTTSAKKRKNLVDAFNDPTTNSFAFLLSSKAGGCGLNLIGANRLVLFDPDWNPATDKQAAARVWREGQKKMCYVYRFLATGTLEEKIFQRQLSKEGLQNIVDDKEEVNSLSSKDLKRLFVFERNTMSDTHDQLQCDRCKWRNAAPVMTDDVMTIDNDHDTTDGSSAVKETALSTSVDDPDAPVDADDAPKNYHPQLGMPQEEDLNSWGHHRSYDAVDDAVMQHALATVRADLVSFAFTCRIDWGLLQEHQAANDERDLQRDEERKRKRREKQEAEAAAAAAAALNGKKGKKPQAKTPNKKKVAIIDDDDASEDFSVGSSDDDEDDEDVITLDDDDSDDDAQVDTAPAKAAATQQSSSSRHHQQRRRASDDDHTTTDDVPASESESESDLDNRGTNKRIDDSLPVPPAPVPKRKISFMMDSNTSTNTPLAPAAPQTLFKRLKSKRQDAAMSNNDDDFDGMDVMPAPRSSNIVPPPAPAAVQSLRNTTSSSIIDEDSKESEPPSATATASTRKSSDVDGWSCARCTLENPLDSDTCGGCALRFRRSRVAATPTLDWGDDDDDF